MKRIFEDQTRGIATPVDKTWWDVLTKERADRLSAANIRLMPIGTYPNGVVGLNWMQTGREQADFGFVVVRLLPFKAHEKAGGLAVGRLVEVLIAGARGGSLSDELFDRTQAGLEAALGGSMLSPADSSLYRDDPVPITQAFDQLAG